MKILHTSDWHLGKKLEGYSRIEEQRKFVDELVKIADSKDIDMIVVAGDIFDVPNPPAEAEILYYEALKRLSNNGERPVVVIAGNHDNPKKITASEPLAREHGIISFGVPHEKKITGNYGRFKVVESYAGGVVIELNNKEKIFVNALPYPSEKMIDGIYIEGEADKTKEEISYSKRIGEILHDTHSNNTDKLKSIIVSHLFIGGSSSDGTERNIELGGSLAFNLADAPKADYIALGHIHKPMKFEKYNAGYSGSNLEYRVSEAKFDKKVIIKDLDTGNLEEVSLTNYKPIREYTLNSIDEAVTKARDLMEVKEWIYLYINCTRPLKNSELRKIKENKNVIEIIPNITSSHIEEEILIENYTPAKVAEAFESFYLKETGSKADEKTRDIFLKLIGEVE